MHLLYARFFTKALRDCGYVKFDEPFEGLLTQGMVLHATYKDPEGKWLFPEESLLRQDVKIGRVEKMSKSKKNLVEPEAIVAKYGADTARLFIMSDSPPERDLEWTESGVDGAYKFLNRLYKFTHDFSLTKSDKNFSGPGLDLAFERKVAKLFNAATQHIEAMQFNSAIAKAREIANALFANNLADSNYKSIENALSLLLQLLAPFVPHICEELWSTFKPDSTRQLIDSPWPEISPHLLEEDEIVIAIQINGKLKDTIKIPKDQDQELLKAHVMQLDKIQAALKGQDVKKIIIVPGKVVNVVL
jgi:leucyl-tRNA synthetase